MNKKNFHPSCAISLYKPELTQRVFEFIKSREPDVSWYDRCCKKSHESGMTIISSCPGCHKAFSTQHEGVDTLMLWEYLSDTDFPFPDYKGIKMTIHDPCNVRGKDTVYNAVRTLLQKMNIDVTEAEKTREKSVCCGASGYGNLSDERILELARKRASDLPCGDVAVYCTSCMYLLRDAGKNTHHMMDLIFNEISAPTPMNLREWRQNKTEFTKK